MKRLVLSARVYRDKRLSLPSTVPEAALLILLQTIKSYESRYTIEGVIDGADNKEGNNNGCMDEGKTKGLSLNRPHNRSTDAPETIAATTSSETKRTSGSDSPSGSFTSCPGGGIITLRLD